MQKTENVPNRPNKDKWMFNKINSHPESPQGIEGSSKFGLWAVSDEQTQAGTV